MFEPNPVNIATLRRRGKISKEAIIHPVAVGEKSGTAAFYFNQGQSNKKCNQYGSMAPNSLGGWMNTFAANISNYMKNRTGEIEIIFYKFN